MATTYDNLAGDQSTIEIVSSPSPAKKQRCGDIPPSPSLVEEDPRSKITVYEYDSDVEDDSNGMHEMTEKEYEEYFRQRKESEGFEIMSFPRSITFGIVAPVDLKSGTWRDLKALSELALKEYNEKEDTNLEFVKVVKANEELCAGLNYYITFDVKDSDVVDGDIIEFQALVYAGICVTEVHMCRPKSSS